MNIDEAWGTCHACKLPGGVKPCPYWLDVENGDPNTERYCCAYCRVECAEARVAHRDRVPATRRD